MKVPEFIMIPNPNTAPDLNGIPGGHLYYCDRCYDLSLVNKNNKKMADDDFDISTPYAWYVLGLGYICDNCKEEMENGQV